MKKPAAMEISSMSRGRGVQRNERTIFSAVGDTDAQRFDQAHVLILLNCLIGRLSI